MIKKLLFSLGLFAFGYVVGKAVGRSESELAGQLEWEGETGSRFASDQPIKDAEFHDSGENATDSGIDAA